MTTHNILMAAAEGGDVPVVRSTYFTDTVAGSGKTKTVPTGAVYMRVAVIGGGGGGNNSGGAGGGGCAATKIIPASTITYTVGDGGTAGNNGGDSTATFTGYSLVGGGGKAYTTSGNGGTASGGDYNFTGGTCNSVTFCFL